jgi:hypothetical protein
VDLIVSSAVAVPRTISVFWQILTASKGSEFEVLVRGRSIQVTVI